VIAYFGTSAVIPLLIGEPSSATCARVWNDAARSISVRLLYPEARAALARAERMGRITKRQHESAVAELEAIVTEIDLVEITTERSGVRAGPVACSWDAAREVRYHRRG